jgi:hypothetical protein
MLCFCYPSLDVVKDFLKLLSYYYSYFIRAGDLLVVLFTSLSFIFLDRVYIVSVLQEERAHSYRDSSPLLIAIWAVGV